MPDLAILVVDPKFKQDRFFRPQALPDANTNSVVEQMVECELDETCLADHYWKFIPTKMRNRKYGYKIMIFNL